MRTQVAIIGGGPSGLLLSQLLNTCGISTVVAEVPRIRTLTVRAGVLESGTVELLRKAGAGTRMDRDGIPHDGCLLASNGRMFRVDFEKSCGRRVMVYGQTEMTGDLYEAQDQIGATIVHDADDVALHDLTSDRPYVTFSVGGQQPRLDCDYIAGCDGFHLVSRKSIPIHARKEFEKVYPFGWLGILSRTQPMADELIYAAMSEASRWLRCVIWRCRATTFRSR